jgi:hypothetical protein
LGLGAQLDQPLHEPVRSECWSRVSLRGIRGPSDEAACLAGSPISINALAEAFNSLFKAELIRNKGPWRGIDDLEIAVAEYIDWFNHRRLHGELGLIPPAEYEARHRDRTTALTPAGA